MTFKQVINTPFQKGHTHNYDYIEKFPGLPEGESFEQTGNRIRNQIRKQMTTLNHEDALKYMKVRDCFTFQEPSYVDFCLQERVGGISRKEAAKILGILKE